MSGLIGHTTYAMLAAKAAAHRQLPIAPVIGQNYASYLAGSYLGSDIQTLPEAVCVDTGQEVGYGTVPLEKSPITGGAVRPWKIEFEGQSYRPRDIHSLFYGRAHIVFGWRDEDKRQAIAWDDIPDYIASVVGDAIDLFGPSRRQLAYIFGWATHVVGDSLIKSVHPGLHLHLINGQYTPQNRPIQDLVTFHEIGVRELKLDWPALLHDLAQTPVEPVQAHYMRCREKGGRLGAHFPDGWVPDKERLLQIVLEKNREYEAKRTSGIIKDLALTKGKDGQLNCSPELSAKTGGLSYQEMIEAADKANFRHTLWEMAEAIADLFEEVVELQHRLQEMPAPANDPSWETLTQRWRKI